MKRPGASIGIVDQVREWIPMNILNLLLSVFIRVHPWFQRIE